MYVRNSRKAHAHCGRCIDAAPACELPLSGRYTAAQSLAVSAAVMLFCRKNRKKPASRRARAVMLLAKKRKGKHPASPSPSVQPSAIPPPSCRLQREKSKRPAGVVENRWRFASESASLSGMALRALGTHPRGALPKLSWFAFFRKGRSLPLFVCAAHCSPLQQKFARLQEAAVPPGMAFKRNRYHHGKHPSSLRQRSCSNGFKRNAHPALRRPVGA